MIAYQTMIIAKTIEFMLIFNHFQLINLTADQRIALEKLHFFVESDERVFVLQGYAGSGKTTLLKGFVEYLQSIEEIFQICNILNIANDIQLKNLVTLASLTFNMMAVVFSAGCYRYRISAITWK